MSPNFSLNELISVTRESVAVEVPALHEASMGLISDETFGPPALS